MAAARQAGRKSLRKKVAVLPEDQEPESTPEEILPDRSRGNLTAPGSRLRAGAEAPLIAA
jgi:hypothetical protein